MPDTHKERMRRAIQHEPVDRIPTQINYTASMGERMAQYFHVDTADLPVFLGNHMRRVDLTYPARVSADGTLRYDWWGAGHSTTEEGYFVADSPLSANRDLDIFAWPDPFDPGLLDDARRVIDGYGAEYFITPNFGFALFERAWTLRGFEHFFMDMSTDPVYTAELLDRITEIQLVLIHRFIDLGVDGAYFGDDYGAQKNLLFSPRMFRQYIKPRLARLFTPFRERGLPIIMHSDGQIQQILPDLVEIGLTTLNPVQPEVLDHRWLRATFAGQLAFYGGISTQTVLPNGSPDEVEQAIRACVADLAPDGTGLVLAPSHRMMTDIPLANVTQMLDVFKTV
jgi:uroporphyrinogen decarboxylase